MLLFTAEYPFDHTRNNGEVKSFPRLISEKAAGRLSAKPA